jgi:hypothetical protein
MKPAQWNVLAVVFFIGFLYLSTLGLSWDSTCASLNDPSMLAACYVKVQSYIIPSIILFLLAIAFWICAAIEKKAKK